MYKLLGLSKVSILNFYSCNFVLRDIDIGYIVIIMGFVNDNEITKDNTSHDEYQYLKLVQQIIDTGK